MTDHQVTLLAGAISAGVPTLAVLIAMLANNRQIDSMRRELEAMRRELEVRFSALDKVLAAQFSEAKAGLLRVEGVLDARLKHLEERER